MRIQFELKTIPVVIERIENDPDAIVRVDVCTLAQDSCDRTFFRGILCPHSDIYIVAVVGEVKAGALGWLSILKRPDLVYVLDDGGM